MHLNKLSLSNFKNYQELDLEFPSRVNFILGLNGSGKTNLLDAIHYLSATRSYVSSSDSVCIRHGADHYFVKGVFTVNARQHEVMSQVQAGRKKIFQEDGRDYEKLSDHIGKYPVVVISPMDVDLVRESSEARRKFFDQMIAQVDHPYLELLVTYHKVLKQRNALLTLFAERQQADETMLEVYDHQLIQAGEKLFARRKQFAAEFLPVFNTAYSFLVANSEEASLTYTSGLNEVDFETGLRMNYKKDLVLQRTTFGIHRDDYVFGFGHGELKKLGSQGQQKSFLVAIKLAQVQVIEAHDGFAPILLLDDIFDKLDDVRIGRLLQRLTGKTAGQLFITDAGPERTKALISQLGITGDVFSVESGHVTKESL